jgi:hypothetical protein
MGIKLQISKRKGIAVLNSAMYSETCLNQTLNKTESCINLSKPNPEQNRILHKPV